MKNYYDERDTYFRQLSGYSIEQLIKKYKRAGKRCIAKYNELDKLSGDVDSYVLHGFWDKQILPSILEKMNTYDFNTKKESEQLTNALFHFHKIEPELDRFIKEIKEHGRISKPRNSSISRFFDWLLHKKK